MRSANSPVNKRYFLYRAKGFLPYGTIMAVVGMAVTIIMNLLVYGTSYRSLTYFIPNEQLIFPAVVFMYIYPVLMAIFLFSFMHKKNASDLFASAPITKTEIYVTNMLIALVYSVLLILIMMFTNIITANIFTHNGITQLVAPTAFLSVFIFLLIGYMLVYTIVATATTITGTVPAQIFSAFTLMLAPTALLILVQFPHLISENANLSFNFNELGEAVIDIYGRPAGSTLMSMNIAAMPLTLIFAAIGNHFQYTFGVLTPFLQAPAMIYSAILIFFYALIGILLFRDYKMENVERPFTKEPIGLAIRCLLFIPIIGFIVLAFYADGFFFNEYCFTLLIMTSIAYVVADLILRKGIKGLSKSLINYAAILIVSITLGVILGTFADKYDNERITINRRDVSGITVYMEPLNVTFFNTENVKEYYIPVEITDSEIISKMLTEDGKGGYYRTWTTLHTEDSEYFGRLGISYDAMDMIYEFIDSNPSVKKNLIVNGGTSKHVTSHALLCYVDSSVTTSKAHLTQITDKGLVRKLMSENEEKMLETPCNITYGNKQIIHNMSSRYGLDYSPEFFGETSTQMVVTDIKYDNGMYMTTTCLVDSDKEEFSKIMSTFDDEVLIACVKDKNPQYRVIGTINFPKEQILNIQKILNDIPSIYGLEFSETVINSLDEEIIQENSVIYSVSGNGKHGYFILNYDRDLKDYVSRYWDIAYEDLCQYDVCNITLDIYHYGEKVRSGIFTDNTEKIIEELRNNEALLKKYGMTKFTPDTMPTEMYTVSLSYYEYDKHGYPIAVKSYTFIIDETFTKTVESVTEAKKRLDEVDGIYLTFYSGDEISLTLMEEDGELFEAMKTAIAYNSLKYDSSINDKIVAKGNYVVYDSMGYTRNYCDAEVIFKDGSREYHGLHISDILFTKLIAHVNSK